MDRPAALAQVTAQPDLVIPGGRALRTIARGLWLVVVALSLAELWMIGATVDRPSNQWGMRGYEAALALSFGSVGALIATKRPGNVIGWLTLVAALATGIQGIVVQYPVLAGTSNPPLSGVDVARWIGAWIWVLPAGLFLGLFPLLFPDGRLPSPRWRPALFLGLCAITVQIAVIILISRPFGPIPPTNNPTPYFELGGPVVIVGYALLWLAGAVSTSSFIYRYRRARGDERQQIKWVAYALVIVVFGAVMGFTPFVFGQFAFIGTALFGAAAVAIAILRYRLYEIDLIINRTLVYGALSAVLAGVYAASITLSQRLFVAVTGERSDAAIVLTTLIVTSTFTPLKTRLQAIVDRRFRPSAHGTFSLTAPSGSGSEALQMVGQLAQLHAAGALTTSEFKSKKAELLGRV
jgi:hypothetical protein